jgi:hypothetical protein
MKKVALFIVLLSISVSVFAKLPKVVDYVITSNGVVYFEKISYGLSHENYLICKNDIGDKVSFSFDEIVSYRKSGKVYEKKPLIEDLKTTENYVFMEYVRYNNGLQVMNYHTLDCNGNEVDNLYVFKAEKFVVDVNDKNYETLADFFSL